MLAQIAGALNGGGLIPGPPGERSRRRMSLIGNPAFTASLLQGVAGAFGYVAARRCRAAGIAANFKPAHHEEQTSFSKTDAFDIFGDVTCQAFAAVRARRRPALDP